MDWANQTLSNAHRGILMGLVRTPPEERDQAAIDASCKECDALFALLDAELAKVKWFSGDEFGVGDIAIAPFIYNLFNVGLTWTRVQICNAGISNSLNAPQCAKW